MQRNRFSSRASGKEPSPDATLMLAQCDPCHVTLLTARTIQQICVVLRHEVCGNLFYQQ